jgi:hypothetical protein
VEAPILKSGNLQMLEPCPVADPGFPARRQIAMPFLGGFGNVETDTVGIPRL